MFVRRVVVARNRRFKIETKQKNIPPITLLQRGRNVGTSRCSLEMPWNTLQQ